MSFTNLFGFVSIFLAIITNASATGLPRRDGSCLRALNPVSNNASIFRFQETFIAKGLDPNRLFFHLKREDSPGRGDPIIRAYYRSDGSADLEFAGEIYLKPERVLRAFFESHINVEKSFRGKGLGLFLYVLAAKLAQKNWGLRLMSSSRPSDEAHKIWQVIVQNGWGEKPLWQRYRFNAELVTGQFEEVYDFFLKRQLANPNDFGSEL